MAKFVAEGRGDVTSATTLCHKLRILSTSVIVSTLDLITLFVLLCAQDNSLSACCIVMQLLETIKHEELSADIGEMEGEWKEMSPECLRICSLQ